MKTLRLTESQYAERLAGGINPYEREVQDAVIALCKMHKSVAWIYRMNTGATKIGERFIRFGFPGLSDVIGQSITGRFIAIEVKREGEKPTEAQQSFLNMVAINGGIAGCAHSAQEAWDILDGV
jgi:hypothetical protein